ncbi:ATP-dependent DNA helicase pfh1-like [Bidens hawaiensis]|uniref:ATP-dependent DNA helicase pfh1-like n=1 Tax=Bidens hawaiensis TaxID=980011 RepID=UPI00404ABF91
MLLNHQVGCTSFTDVRTVNGTICNTYRAACEKLGLLVDDNEWSLAFDEARSWATPKELRMLFAHILLHCEVSNPVRLWENQWTSMAEDFTRNTETFAVETHDCVPEETLRQYVLYELEFIFNSYSTDSSLKKYGLPLPNEILIRSLQNRLLMEEKNYDREELAQQHIFYIQSLHPQQREVYDYVTTSLEANNQVLAFVYGHGGTGKTFLWTTLTSYLRSQGKVVLTVAASGIASLLLPSGRTAHSRFKIPIDLTDNSNCNISKNTQLSQLLVEITLIIWDEAPMSNRKCFEALDRTLKDILNNNKDPFGGKSILLGGDFRQTLPIVKRNASKSEIISSSLPRSYLWCKFKIFRLTQNMRVLRPNISPDKANEISDFSN